MTYSERLCLAHPVRGAILVYGMSSATDRARLDSLLRRGKWLGCCINDVPTVTELFNSADDDFFYSVKTNSTHVLQSYLPDQTNIPYRLRTRAHNMTMINKTKFLNVPIS